MQKQLKNRHCGSYVAITVDLKPTQTAPVEKWQALILCFQFQLILCNRKPSLQMYASVLFLKKTRLISKNICSICMHFFCLLSLLLILIFFSLFFFPSLPFKLSSSILDIYNSDQGMAPANMGLTNASCPANLPVKRELTGKITLRFQYITA